MSNSEKKPEMIKTLAKDIKPEMVIEVPAERAKVLKIEPLNKSIPTMSKGLYRIEVEMVSGINNGNKTSFVSKEDDKLLVIPNVRSWADFIKGSLSTTLFLCMGVLCYGFFG